MDRVLGGRAQLKTPIQAVFNSGVHWVLRLVAAHSAGGYSVGFEKQATLSDFHLAVLLSLLAAATFAFGAQFSRLGLRSIDAQSGAMVSIASATLLYWLVAPWHLKLEYWLSSAVLFFIVVGFFRPALSITFAMIGTSILGPTISTTLSSTAPFFGLLLGVAVLGEELTWTVSLGTGAIVLGIIALTRRDGGQAKVNWPLWALALPILAAVIRVCAHLLNKVGMESIPSPYFAGLVAYNVSLAVSLANFKRRKLSFAPLMTNRDVWWFVATGILFGAAIFTVNLALSLGPLSVVAPLVSLESIFVMILGLLVFKERKFTLRITLAVLLVVGGAVAISSRS